MNYQSKHDTQALIGGKMDIYLYRVSKNARILGIKIKCDKKHLEHRKKIRETNLFLILIFF